LNPAAAELIVEKPMGTDGAPEGAAGLSDLEKCNRIIADLERRGIDISSFKRLLSQLRGDAGEEEVIDAVLGRLRRSIFVQLRDSSTGRIVCAASMLSGTASDAEAATA